MLNFKKKTSLIVTAILLAQGIFGLTLPNAAQAVTYPTAMQEIMSRPYPITMGNQFMESSINSSVVQRIARDLDYVSINRSTDLFDDRGTSISIANQIRAINPNTKVLQYLNLIDVWSYEPVSYPWIINNKAYLKDDAGRIIYPYQSTYGTQRISGDPQNTNWQNYYAQHAKSIVNQGMDGIMSDNWMRSNWQNWNINSARFTQLEYAWNTVGQRTKAAIGANKILIGNGPAWYTYQNSRDVAMIEMKNAPNATAFNYYLQMSDLAASYNQADQDTQNPSESESNILNFYLPACLLTDNVFGISNNSVQFAALEQVGKIGRPKNSRYVSAGILQRDFTGGKVLLNNTYKTVTVTLPAGVYSNVYGSKVNSVTLAAFTGAILKGSGATPIPPTPTPTAGVPATPTNVVFRSLYRGASTGLEYVNLNWTDNSTNETGFQIQQSINSTTNFQTVMTIPAGSTTCAVNIGTTPAAGTYYYRVIAVNSAGQSQPSNTASAQIGSTTTTPPSSTTIPSAPSKLAPNGITKNSSAQVLVGLKWQNNATNATSLEILQSINSTSNFKVVATLAANSTYYSLNIGAAPTHGTYYYEVVALNSAGQSSPSNIQPMGIN